MFEPQCAKCDKILTTENCEIDSDGVAWCKEHFMEMRIYCLERDIKEKREHLEKTHLKDLRDMEQELENLKHQ